MKHYKIPYLLDKLYDERKYAYIPVDNFSSEKSYYDGLYLCRNFRRANGNKCIGGPLSCYKCEIKNKDRFLSYIEVVTLKEISL